MEQIFGKWYHLTVVYMMSCGIKISFAIYYGVFFVQSLEMWVQIFIS
jgi:hypothetical protein